MDSHLSASQDPSASSLLGGRSNLPRSRSGCVHLESSRKACAPRCWMCCWMVWGILKRTWYLKNTNQLLLSLYMMIMENCGLDVSWWTPKTNDIKIRTFETWRISTNVGSHPQHPTTTIDLVQAWWSHRTLKSQNCTGWVVVNLSTWLHQPVEAYEKSFIRISCLEAYWLQAKVKIILKQNRSIQIYPNIQIIS